MSLVYMFIADGFEEVEGLTSVDLLRRAGIEVKMISVMGRKNIEGAHGIKLETDLLIEELEDNGSPADMMVLPGGMPGTNFLRESAPLADLLKAQYEAGRYVAAICAAPSVLAGLSFLKGRRATSYPGCLDGYEVGEYCQEPVVTDGHVITSRGVGTAIPFALTLIEKLEGAGKAEQIASSILYSTEYLQGVDYVSGR